MPDDRFIDLKEVMRLTALSKTTVYKMVREGRFPDRFNAGEVKVVWSYNDVQDWIRSVKESAAS